MGLSQSRLWPFIEAGNKHAGCQDIIVHPEFDSPRWRQCPLDLQRIAGPLVLGKFLDALDDSLLEKIIWLLISASDKSCVRDLLALSATCSRLRRLVMQQAVWQELCVLHYGAPRTLKPKCPNWFKLYQFNHEGFMNLIRAHMGHGGVGMPQLTPGTPLRIIA